MKTDRAAADDAGVPGTGDVRKSQNDNRVLKSAGIPSRKPQPRVAAPKNRPVIARGGPTTVCPATCVPQRLAISKARARNLVADAHGGAASGKPWQLPMSSWIVRDVNREADGRREQAAPTATSLHRDAKNPPVATADRGVNGVTIREANAELVRADSKTNAAANLVPHTAAERSAKPNCQKMMTSKASAAIC